MSSQSVRQRTDGLPHSEKKGAARAIPGMRGAQYDLD
jgi:hypothetical protein